MSLRAQVAGAGRCWRLPLCRRELEAALGRMAEAAGKLGVLPDADAEVDLLIVRDAAMARLNARHMRCAGPTNVLSFPGGTFAGDAARPGAVSLGSLVLCADAVGREALLYGQEPAEHCLRLLAHGLGHLAGYDHGHAMNALCDAMLAAAREDAS